MSWTPVNLNMAARRRRQETELARSAWLLACDLASRHFGSDVRVAVQTRGVVGRGGDGKTSAARKVACYLAQVVVNASTARLAEASGLDRSSIHHNACWVEDERERNPLFDRMVSDLEDRLLSMATSIVLAHLTARGEAPEPPPALCLEVVAG